MGYLWANPKRILTMSLLLTLLLLLSPPVHDYHVSKTNVRYVAERSQLQVEMQVFVDDLEEAMVLPSEGNASSTGGSTQYIFVREGL